MTEDEMVDGSRHEFEQAPGVGDGLVSLAYCSPWGCKQLDTTEGLKNNWSPTGHILQPVPWAPAHLLAQGPVS